MLLIHLMRLAHPCRSCARHLEPLFPRRAPSGLQNGAKHTVQHYDVLTRLFSPETSAVYTDEDNATCVATDTQRNAVYLVAKRSKARRAATPLHALVCPQPHARDMMRALVACRPLLSKGTRLI